MFPLDPVSYFAFLGSVFVLALTPGTDNIYVLTRTLSQGKAAGLLAASGIALALMVHVAAATLGLGQLFLSAPRLYEAVRYLGIAYLLYLAYGAMTAAATAPEIDERQHGPARHRIVGQAALLCLLNPKLLVFFVAFLPQFTEAARGSMTLQLFFLGTSFALESLTVFVLMIFLVAPLRGLLLSHAGFWRWQGRATGAVLAALAAWLILSEI